MKPINHPLCNDVLMRPDGLTEEQCQDLPIHRSEASVTSFWRPAASERHAIYLGQPIILEAQGKTHPPVSVGVLACYVEHVPLPVSDRVRDIADSYIKEVFETTLPARQTIELKLALYGGMMAMIQELCLITDRHEGDAVACADEIKDLRSALINRSQLLNEERSKI